jgi:hypothetical protein
MARVFAACALFLDVGRYAFAGIDAEQDDAVHPSIRDVDPSARWMRRDLGRRSAS